MAMFETIKKLDKLAGYWQAKLTVLLFRHLFSLLEQVPGKAGALFETQSFLYNHEQDHQSILRHVTDMGLAGGYMHTLTCSKKFRAMMEELFKLGMSVQMAKSREESAALL